MRMSKLAMSPMHATELPTRGGGRVPPWQPEDVTSFAKMLGESDTIRACQRYPSRNAARYHAEKLRKELASLGCPTTMRIWTETTLGGSYYVWALTRLDDPED